MEKLASLLRKAHEAYTMAVVVIVSLCLAAFGVDIDPKSFEKS